MQITSTALGGIQAAERLLDRTARNIASATAGDGDSVDLSAEMVALIEARTLDSANVSVVHTADDMEKQLLDVLA